MADSNTSTPQDLIDDFALFDDWEERYRYLIDLGRGLPVMDDALKTDSTLVQGCTSRVWIHADATAMEEGRLHMLADSDAHIVRGLIALLMRVYQDKALSEIAQIDIEAAFKEIGLDQHLSPNRRNGFFSMLERVNQLAARA